MPYYSWITQSTIVRHWTLSQQQPLRIPFRHRNNLIFCHTFDPCDLSRHIHQIPGIIPLSAIRFRAQIRTVRFQNDLIKRCILHNFLKFLRILKRDHTANSQIKSHIQILPDKTKYTSGRNVKVQKAPYCTSRFFTGWNTRADGKGTRYLPGQTFKIKQNITLYAQWSLSYTASSLIYRVTGRQTVTCYGTSNSRLNRVVIPLTIKCTGVTYKVTSVWTKAFTGKKNLTSVVIGNNVTTIGSQAFYNCKNLKTVTIGTGLTRIGSQAFRNVKAKCVITIKSQKLKAVSSKIDQGVKQMTVRVPKAKYSAYNRLLRKKSKSVIIKKF